MLRGHYKVDTPNELQEVHLADIDPNPDQPRLFIERESLEKLEAMYTASLTDSKAVLPDPPILRYIASNQKLKLLGGHRRIQSASNVGKTSILCRVVQMTDEEAFEFVMAHNDYVNLTTVEMAYRVAEMDRMGYTTEEIQTQLKIGINRYLAVGALVSPDDFDDRQKLCDPSITVWYEAAKHGEDHFKTCFNAWNAGLWDEEQCQKYFRKRGRVLPLDNNEKGLRLTVSSDGTKLKARGTLDFDLLTREEVRQISKTFIQLLNEYTEEGLLYGNFGGRAVHNINPDTLP